MSIIVSDHAVLRWLERVEKIDIESLRAQIAASAAIGKQWGAASVVVSGGKIVLSDDRVVTVLSRQMTRYDLVGKLEVELPNRDVIMHRRLRRRRK